MNNFLVLGERMTDYINDSIGIADTKFSINKEIMAFSDIEIEKPKYHCWEHPVNFINVDIDKELISKKFSFHLITVLVTEMMKSLAIMYSA